jgi:hypothetical protein
VRHARRGRSGFRRAGGSDSGDAGGAERADAGAREACAGARRPEQSEHGERARRRCRAARWSGRSRARGDMAARVSAGSAAGGREGGVAVQSDGTRRRSYGGKLLREMRECGDRIEDAVKVFDEMSAAGEAKPSLRIVSHQTSDSGKHAGGASHSDGSKSEIGMIEFIGMLNVKVMGGKRRTSDAEDGRWPRRVDASSLACEMHEERRAGRRGGEAKAATGCDELGGATHGELPSPLRRSRQKQCSAGSTRSVLPAAVVGRP